MDITDALKLIIARSPRAGQHALQAIAAARNNSPVLQARYQQVLMMAFSDPNAEFSQAERADLASAIEADSSGTRDFTLRVRLTDGEHIALQDAAGDMSLSEYVRHKLFE